VLYNKKADVTFRIRKVSSHGLGSFQVSSNYQSLSHIPTPDVPLDNMGLSNNQRWIYDLWYDFIERVEHDKDLTISYNLSLDTPAYNQATIATSLVYDRFKHMGVKPFNFLTVLPALDKAASATRLKKYSGEEKERMRAEYEKTQVSSLYTPYTREPEKVQVFHSIKTNEPITGIQPITIEECLLDYFKHPESKSENGDETGIMRMRHVRVTKQIAQGKETSYDILELEENGLVEDELSYEMIDIEYTREDFKEILHLPESFLLEHGISLNRLMKLRKDAIPTKKEHMLLNSIKVEIQQWHDTQVKIRERGINEIARQLGVRPNKIARIVARDYPPDRETLAKILEHLT